MKFILSLMILFLGLTFAQKGYGQEVKPKEAKTVTVYKTDSAAIGKGTKSSEWIVINGQSSVIYVGSRGGRYYITRNAKGELIRKYISKTL
jgi:hypothetical protein